MVPPVDPDSSRYLRQHVLAGFGSGGQHRLASARVLVVGAGGVGSAVIPAIAAAGVGTIVIVDDDTVEASNLARQTLHSAADVGRPKVDSAADAIARIAPEVVVVRHAERFTSANADGLLAGIDVLVDASDNASARYVANDAAAARGIPMVWGSAIGYTGQAGVAWDAAGADYRDLFPWSAGADDQACDVVGVLGTVCVVIGGTMAGEVVKLLTGIGQPLIGRAVLYDGLSGRTREVAFRRDPEVGARGRDGGERGAAVPRNRVASAPEPTALAVGDLVRLLGSPTPPLLLDVRTDEEVAATALTGATTIPLAELPDRLPELENAAGGRETPIVVVCRRGIRSADARELLAAAGFSDVRHLDGGLDAWRAVSEPGMLAR